MDYEKMYFDLLEEYIDMGIHNCRTLIRMNNMVTQDCERNLIKATGNSRKDWQDMNDQSINL